MERNQAIAIAVVVAALALFGLKIWSDRAAESDLNSGSQAAAQRLARAGGVQQSDLDTRGGGEGGGRMGRAGEPGSLRPGGFGGSGGVGSRLGGPEGRGGAGGSADVVRGGGSKVGSGLGFAAGGRPSGGTGSGASITGGGGGAEDSGHLGPKVQQKDNLVQFLSSQPPTAQDLASAKDENGDDIALKVDHTDDIGRQGGQEKDVHQGDDGDGIKISDRGKIEFPNYANGDAATISFNIQPDWAGSDQTDNALVEIRQEHEWANRLELVKNGEFLRFIVTPDSGQEADISVRINDWQPGDSHDVRASYGKDDSGNGWTYLYIDNQLVGKTPYTGTLQFPQGTPMYLGGDHNSSNYQGANASIRDFTLKNSATNQ